MVLTDTDSDQVLLRFRIFRHLLMNLREFLQLGSAILERLSNIGAVVYGSSCVLGGTGDGVLLVRLGHLRMFLGLDEEILGLCLVVHGDAAMFGWRLCRSEEH